MSKPKETGLERILNVLRGEKDVTKQTEHRTRISFDLDEVLFVDPSAFETEPPLNFPYNHIYRERLRKGTVNLIHTLQEEDFEVWVYTSSYRTEQYIRSLFRNYGVQFDGIINMPRHLREVQKNRKELLPQKMPGFYRIALHVDDEDVIHRYGKMLGFKTIKVCDPDPDWDQKVLAEARLMKERESKQNKETNRLQTAAFRVK